MFLPLESVIQTYYIRCVPGTLKQAEKLPIKKQLISNNNLNIMEQDILQRLQKLENRFKMIKRLFWSFICCTIIMLSIFGFTKNDSFNIIRAKGIIIEDDKGKDRILIGSPIPFSKNRVRTDTLLVRKYWASKFKNPDQYMSWYEKYSHSADGIVFINEQGFDEVLIGEDLADANVGVRLYKISGMIVNNKQGWERVGAGVNTLDNGETRQGFGVDDDSGEALHMMTFEDGSKGLIIGGENGSLRIGIANKEGELLQNKGKFTGIKYFDNKGNTIWEQNFDIKTHEKK